MKKIVLAINILALSQNLSAAWSSPKWKRSKQTVEHNVTPNGKFSRFKNTYEKSKQYYGKAQNNYNLWQAKKNNMQLTKIFDKTNSRFAPNNIMGQMSRKFGPRESQNVYGQAMNTYNQVDGYNQAQDIHRKAQNMYGRMQNTYNQGRNFLGQTQSSRAPMMLGQTQSSMPPVQNYELY